ncbi:UTP--glucose-1-phosphate uridylyltransferase [Calothrix rhizosoleniae]|uniref:UTP--glucose-1-phosphate uridylyltransferase n=1 Tax=Calothrix rhizosoleniae TaxID=888997 RepID=UPI000B4A3265|nr:UTP--glucose-1-phosphate uridylyltransferase [Calothrix rhizosoleniae]
MQINQVKKAVIPAAGFGTRLFPATKVVKKELFPIIDRDGRAKPVIQVIVEEAISAGIAEIAIVTQPEDKEVFADYFQTLPHPSLFAKLSPENQEYSRYLQDLGSKITILTQDRQEGYGHAVFCAQEWVKDEPFLLMLGDHIYSSDSNKSCTKQILNVYEQVNCSVLGLTIMPGETISKAGCATGKWQELSSILTLTQIYEKPTLEYARQNLRVEGMKDDDFLCVFGLYILTPKIFDLLGENISNNFREKGEFQLTSCLEKLRQLEGMAGYIIQGKCFDIGMPDCYRQTMIDFP